MFLSPAERDQHCLIANLVSLSHVHAYSWTACLRKSILLVYVLIVMFVLVVRMRGIRCSAGGARPEESKLKVLEAQ